MYWSDHMGWGGYTLMAISMVAFWGLLIVGGVALFRSLSRGGQPTGVAPPERPTAEQMLAERFARGEIDEDEYRRRLDTLRTSGRSVAPL